MKTLWRERHRPPSTFQARNGILECLKKALGKANNEEEFNRLAINAVSNLDTHALQSVSTKEPFKD